MIVTDYQAPAVLKKPRRFARIGWNNLMRLSWNEVRVRAAGFAQEWRNTVRERSETQSFYNEPFRIYRRRHFLRGWSNG